MEDVGTIINILKNLKGNYNDVVRYCGTNKKINKICKEYAKHIFGITYKEIIYSVAIQQSYPTLHHHISLDTLYKYYGNYPEIWKELHLEKYYTREIPMCQSVTSFDYEDNEENTIDPSDPKNLRYIAPFHKPILGNNKKLTFLFFRRNNKLPTNLFMLENDEILTPYHFIELALNEYNIEISININSKNFLYDNYNRKIWEKYINDSIWKSRKYSKYYPLLSLDEELKKIKYNKTCDNYFFYGFRETEITNLFRRSFNIDHPVVEILFNT